MTGTLHPAAPPPRRERERGEGVQNEGLVNDQIMKALRKPCIKAVGASQLHVAEKVLSARVEEVLKPDEDSQGKAATGKERNKRMRLTRQLGQHGT